MGVLAYENELLQQVKIYLIPFKGAQPVANRLQQFMGWIEHLTQNGSNIPPRNHRNSTANNAHQTQGVILIAHNGDKFDHRILEDACWKYGVPMAGNVRHFQDSIPLFKQVLTLRPLKLETLVQTFLPDMDFEGE